MQNKINRNDLITEIAKVINNIKLSHPVRVAIDGGGNAGKTTLANELSKKLNSFGRSVIQSTIDGFHNPPEIRRKQGKYSPKGYFEDSYNYPLLKKYLLNPLSPNGNLVYKKSVYNFRVNQETDVEYQKAEPDSILIFDGIFLFNDKLISYWDYKIYVDTSFENAMQRAIIRDNELFNGTENVIKLYKKRYIPGQEMYISKHNPIDVSDLVLNNNDYVNPNVTKISNNKLHNDLLQFELKNY